MFQYGKNGDLEKMKDYISNNPQILKNQRIYNHQGGTLLSFPVCEGYIEIVKYLLSIGFSPNDRNFKSNETALNIACYRSRFEIVKILISHGADLNYVDANHLSPLIICIMFQKWEIAEYLLAKGAILNFGCRNKEVQRKMNQNLTPQNIIKLENIYSNYIYIYIYK